MSTQDQRTPCTDAWMIAEFPDKPRNVHVPRNNYQTALNLPVNRRPPADQQRQFSVREGGMWIHVYDLFIRASDEHGPMPFSEDTRLKIMETMVKMFVPDNSVQEDSLPDDVLVPMQPYRDMDSGENVTVITTLPFNSMDGQLMVFVAPVDGDGWVDVTRSRACLKTLLAPALDGPEVQTTRAVQDIRDFFLQGFSPTAAVPPTTGEQQDREPRDLQHEDMVPVCVLLHFKKWRSKFGTHRKMCRLCKENAGPLFHATICRASFCQRCNSVACMIACHMGRCVNSSCPLSQYICANDICIPVFVHGRLEPTVLFVSLVRLVLARILRFDA
ncbi:uncharacterized protein LOC144911039 isoform X2 [Branchiostoma floridae x Branchiostoma belcheri]